MNPSIFENIVHAGLQPAPRDEDRLPPTRSLVALRKVEAGLLQDETAFPRDCHAGAKKAEALSVANGEASGEGTGTIFMVIQSLNLPSVRSRSLTIRKQMSILFIVPAFKPGTYFLANQRYRVIYEEGKYV